MPHWMSLTSSAGTLGGCEQPEQITDPCLTSFSSLKSLIVLKQPTALSWQVLIAEDLHELGDPIQTYCSIEPFALFNTKKYYFLLIWMVLQSLVWSQNPQIFTPKALREWWDQQCCPELFWGCCFILVSIIFLSWYNVIYLVFLRKQSCTHSRISYGVPHGSGFRPL